MAQDNNGAKLDVVTQRLDTAWLTSLDTRAVTHTHTRVKQKPVSHHFEAWVKIRVKVMVAQRPSEGRKAEKTVLGQRRITKRVPRSGPGH